MTVLCDNVADFQLLLGSADGNFDNEYFQETHESNQFRQEYEMRKKQQVSFCCGCCSIDLIFMFMLWLSRMLE